MSMVVYWTRVCPNTLGKILPYGPYVTEVEF